MIVSGTYAVGTDESMINLKYTVSVAVKNAEVKVIVSVLVRMMN